jgi:hypothetical protein
MNGIFYYCNTFPKEKSNQGAESKGIRKIEISVVFKYQPLQFSSGFFFEVGP